MITLNNTDADWIANVAREELKSLQEAQEEIMNEIADLEKKAEEILKEHPEWPEELKEKLAETKAKSMEANQKYLNEESAKWQKVIELMIIGSEE